MPIASEDLAYLAKLTLSDQLKKTPVDQLKTERPLLGMLLRDRKNFLGGKSISQTVIKDYGSNFTNAKGESPITFNKRTPTDMAEFDWTRATDAYYIAHDTLKQNGITVKEGKRGECRMSSYEKVQLANILSDTAYALKEGFLENLDAHLHLNGAQAADCIPGLDALIATDPTTGTVGGFDRSAATWWRNNANLNIAPANILQGEFTLKFKIDAATFINYYSNIFTKAALSRITGINERQLWHYAAGVHKPRKRQLEKIQKGLDSLTEELSAINLL